MTNIANCQNSAYFIFDLEFIGQVQALPSCQIWEIAVLCKDTGQYFVEVIDPDPNISVFPPPPAPFLPQLTREFLEQEKAQTFDLVLEKLIQWVHKQTNGLPIFISHNTFKADKPILELEAARYSQTLPLHWFFFDSLHFCRDHFKSDDDNFSLSGLNQHLFNRPIEAAHRAKNDVIACTAILEKITGGSWHLIGPIYSSYTTNLRSIRWIGKKAEILLLQHQICSVENLLQLLKRNCIQDYLQQSLTHSESVSKTISLLLGSSLPPENIVNIVNVILTTVFTSYLIPSSEIQS
tara:strand:- start:2030 stop:2911 length:882 start_codon:yes stop_codon:yes gene_type:complete